ncbi:MAG: LysM peptidoglycan-binding domain-containing protein [Phycisphaerae bacterium]
MRPDIKLGLVISAVFVLVAGGYYLYRDKEETPVTVATGEDTLADRVAPGASSRAPSEPGARSAGHPGRGEVPGSHSSLGVKKRDAAVVNRASPAKRKLTTTPAKSKTAEKVTSTRGDSGSAPEGTNKAVTARKGQPPVSEPHVVKRSSDQARPAHGPRQTEEGQAGRVAARVEPKRPVSLAARKPNTGPHSSESKTDRQEAAVDIHRVQPGDTLSSLAVAYYGSAKYTRLLVEGNPDIADPDRLPVGTIVRIPPRPKDRTLQPVKPSRVAKAPSGRTAGDGRTYRVKSGDSFYSIARDVLGDASRWKELFELNKALVDGEPTRLQVDQVVVLPNP